MAEPISKATPETERLAKTSITSPEATGDKIKWKSERKIRLKTVDDFEFMAEEFVAMEFGTLREFIDEEEFDYNSFIPVLNVSGETLSKIIDYYKKHQDFLARNLGNATASDVSDDAKAYDEEFAKDKSDNKIKELLLAAHYLDVKDLMDLLCTKVADRIAEKRVEYVREFFGIENDYTEEELYDLWAQNTWAFEGVDEEFYEDDEEEENDENYEDEEDVNDED